MQPLLEPGPRPADLAVVIVSSNTAHFLPACLGSLFARAGDVELEAVVVCNADDGSAELVERDFPSARVVRCENRGFAHGNNRGLLVCDARYVLFLNPDTEILEGTLAELVALLDRRPELGLAGVRQLTPDGVLYPTIRRFPTVGRALAASLGYERWPVRPRGLGERELDPAAYDRETPCDWTTGAFMLARREAIQAAGLMDERFFLYSEEPDLCLRIKAGGWEVRHLPQLTILHHAGKGGVDARLAAQDAFSRVQYARKHSSPSRTVALRAALGLGYLVRWALGSGAQRRAQRAAFRVVAGLDGPPFGPGPERAVAPAEEPA